ncbi:MAG TPA: hypothetical protein DD473_20725 [Planctomycetaceae bacterium]|nr:hypothetical protein [Planctomycetaceae bacterium]|tara:strand:+ start:284 stop:1708 length:1425 start_codon:yes stop_codon:yes gene_type:complete
MTRIPFSISKSEAVLVGRCVELYLRSNADEFTTPFSTVIENYLKPFLPAQDPFAVIESVTLPGDADWIVNEGEGNRGGILYSRSTPAVIYVSVGGVHSAVSFGRKKKFLDQLLIEWVREILPDGYERWFLSPEEELRAFIQDLDSLRAENKSEATEDHKALAAEIMLLFSDEQNVTARDFFEVGRLLAKLLIGVQRVLFDIQQFHFAWYPLTDPMDEEESQLWQTVEDSQVIEPLNFQEFISPSDWAVDCLASLSRLAELECVERCTQANLWLHHLIQDVRLLPEDVNQPYADGLGIDEFGGFIFLAHSIRGFAMLLQGELSGRHHQEDDETWKLDARSFCPRMLKLSANSQLARVHGSLDWLQDHYFTSKITREPGIVVTLLKDGIEAIVKTVWPSDFVGRTTLSAVLKQRINTEKGKALVLAQTAMHLHKVYRNPSTHDFNHFNVTLGQAYAFAGEIRVMAEIAETLLRDRD